LKGGGGRSNAPGKARFHLAAGIFPTGYKRADVDGLVSSDGDKKPWMEEVCPHFLSLNFRKRRQ